jgi:hypothetical protein
MEISDYVLALLGPIPESSMPKNRAQAEFLETETRALVREKGEEWVRKNRQFLLAQLSFIWHL